jgi:hypothetical protein
MLAKYAKLLSATGFMAETQQYEGRVIETVT